MVCHLNAKVTRDTAVLSGGRGAPSQQGLTSHIALTCWRLGCRTHPLLWDPTHIPEEGADGLREDLVVEAWLLMKRRAGLKGLATANTMEGTALARELWQQEEEKGPMLWEGDERCTSRGGWRRWGLRIGRT